MTRDVAPLVRNESIGHFWRSMLFAASERRSTNARHFSFSGAASQKSCSAAVCVLVVTWIPDLSGCDGSFIRRVSDLGIKGRLPRSVAVRRVYSLSLKKEKSPPADPLWHSMQPFSFPDNIIRPLGVVIAATVPSGLYLIQYQSPPFGL